MEPLLGMSVPRNAKKARRDWPIPSPLAMSRPAGRGRAFVSLSKAWSHQEQAMCPYTSAHELHVMLSIGRTPGNATAEEIDPHTMLSNFARRKSPRRCSCAELLGCAAVALSGS